MCEAKKRVQGMAIGLGLQDRSAADVTNAPEYEDELIEAASGRPEGIQTLEVSLVEFIRDNSRKLLTLPPMPPTERHLVHMLSAHYRLLSQAIDPGSKRCIQLYKKPNSRVPSVSLTTASRRTSSAPPADANAQVGPRRKTKHPINAFILSGARHDLVHEELQSHLDAALANQLHYRAEWTNDGDIYVVCQMGELPVDGFESRLWRLRSAVREQLVLTGLVADVAVGWVNRDMKLVGQRRQS